MDEQQSWKEDMEQEIHTLRHSLDQVNTVLERLVEQQAAEPPRKRAALEASQPDPEQEALDDSEIVTQGLLGLAGHINETSRVPTTSVQNSRRTDTPHRNLHFMDAPPEPPMPPVRGETPDEGSSATRTDLLNNGTVTLAQAVDFFYFYFRVLDPHICHLVAPLHGVSELPERPLAGTPLSSSVQRVILHAIESVRGSSNLLFVAILCVAALHMRRNSPEDALYPILYREYIRLTAMQAFSRHQTLDDIRALVIGSFWFNDVSWTLVGTAVRIVTERHMHESYARWVPSAPLLRRKRQDTSLPSVRTSSEAGRTPPAGRDGSQAHIAYEEARLYYLIYIADHQSSIPYRRPPMTRQHEVIRRAVEWLSNCPWAENRSDTRLVALVKMWEILHDAIDEIGSDLHAPLDELGLAFHARFQSQVEAWHQTWSREFMAVDVFERCDMNRQRLYAELFLHSMAFRADKDTAPVLFSSQVTQEMMGESNSAVKHACFQAERRRVISENAVDAAHQILQLLAADVVRMDTLVGSTSYSHTMTTFAIVLLVKALKQFGNEEDGRFLRGADLRAILRSVDPALRTLVAAAQCVAKEHMLVNITAGAKQSIEQIRAAFTSMHPEGYFAPFPGNHRTPVQSVRESTVLRDSSRRSLVAEAWTTPARAHRTPVPTFETHVHDEWVNALDSLENFDLLSGPAPLSGVDLFNGTSLQAGVDVSDLSSMFAATQE